jgi:hypothetical protein
MSTNIDVGKLLPKVMQTDFWEDLCDSISDELELLKTEISNKIDLYYVRDITDESQLFEIATTFGYSPDRSLDDSLAYFKQEINSISFRIKKKTSYQSYDYIFSSIPIIGYVYNLFWDGLNLIKAVDSTTTETYITTQDYSLPFTHVIPEYYYTSLLNEAPTLDSGQNLDENWTLDINIQKISTHHIAIEVVPVTLITYLSQEYLLTLDYLNFLLKAANYTRKATEVPHVGVQLSLITDQSRYYDNLSLSTYTVPSLKANFAVTQNFAIDSKFFMFYKLCAGIGQQPMFSRLSPPPGNISSLSNEIYCKTLSDGESTDLDNWWLINSYIPSGTILNYIFATGDGSTSSLSGNFSYTNIIPLTITLDYESSSVSYSIDDDGVGNLSSSTFTGTINYSTGVYIFNFYKDYDITDEIISSGSVSTLNTNTANQNLLVETFTVTYFISSTQYTATTDIYGTISGTGISSGYITATGLISITFTTVIDASNVTANYTYRQYSIPDSGTSIYISYRTEEQVSITEIGIKNYSGQLIAYATVPPIYAPNSIFHLGLEFFIQK